MAKSNAHRKWLLTALKVAVTLGLFWLIAQKIDLADIANRLGRARLPELLAATGLIFVQMALNSERWRRLLALDAVALPFARAYRYYLEAMFFNQALPGAIGGDVMRIYRVRAHCSGLGQAFNSVVLDRMIGLVGLCALIAAGLPLLLQRIGDTGPAAGLGLLFALGLVGIGALLLIARLPEEGAGGAVRRTLVRFAKLAMRLMRRPADGIPVLLLALATHGLLVTTAWLTAQSLGLDFTLIDCLIVVPVAVLIATLPISLGGWGVRESAMAAGFVLIGAQAAGDAGAVALSILLGLEFLAIGLIGGLVWFFGGAVRPEAAAAPPLEEGR
jgi:uncharacterized membrane protein YbhN (UPF0104 family)